MTTARSIITRALRLNKVIAANEPGNAADLDVCLTALNGMLDSWSIDRNFVLATTIESFSATGALSYTIGAAGNFVTTPPISIPIVEYSVSGVDTTLDELTELQYASLTVKTTTGEPEGYWFVKGDPLAKLYVYPVPASGTFKLHSVKELTAFTGLDTAYSLSPGYEEALVFSLAEAVAPEFDTEPSKFVIVQAMKRRRSLKRSNVEVPVLDLGEVAGRNFRYDR